MAIIKGGGGGGMVKIPSPVNVRGVEHCGAGFQISLVVNVLLTDELDGNFLWFFFLS